MKDNQEISLLSMGEPQHVPTEILSSMFDFVGFSSPIEEQNADSHNSNLLPIVGGDNTASPIPVAADEGLTDVPSVPVENSQAQPVSGKHDDFLHACLKRDWEEADRLRQQVDLNPGDKKLREEWHKACLKWSQQNRDIGPIPQVELKPQGGKVGKNGKPPMPKTLKCPFCETWTQNSSALKRHLILELKDYKPFGCEVCSASFCRKDALKQHSQVHRDRT
ncbi:hypothetical protein DAKH74_037900 [Maudiozyma humilis]|uniref:C2H2-type domain-containing protein n=1 Tax=Maudiozyma humilis TaxID=51915 RepID=A0AAV5RZY7_MAUHU|nr:hypothetical protein DAKH74_037900 [Kazachstania humilis]